jgi:murein DD-endopeptidase MepM/ murein hydrolase activator NlpD
MQNPLRIFAVGAAALFVVGFGTVLTPNGELEPPADAPVLGAFYARPAEQIETHVLRRGETLSQVFERSGITDQSDLMMALMEFVNPRRLTDDTEITVRRLTGLTVPRTVDVRVNADSTIRLAHHDWGWQSELKVTPTTVDTVYALGTIERGRALYQTIAMDEGLNLPVQERYALAEQVVSIYKYKLDFAHDIQPGDQYRVVYEREARPDGSARSRRVLISEITNDGEDFTAVYFSANGRKGDYYDRAGKSLRYQFSKYPMSISRITSGFGQRFHPVLGIYRAHLGTDFGASYGTPVQATGQGTVQFVGVKGGYGNMVILRHPNGYTTHYAHLSRFARGLRVGKEVEFEQTIGYVGATGLATGPHLHYELRKGGRAVNARTATLPGAPPLPSAYKRDFARLVEQRTALLNRAERRGPTYAARPTEPESGRTGI